MGKDYDAEHLKDLERIKEFRLMDDTFMNKVFENKVCVQLLLRIILGKNDLIVERVHCQYDIKNLQGRSVRLDIFAYDGQGNFYDIEVQRSDDGADPKRARYNSAVLDANLTKSGDAYKDLKDSFVIFITEKDIYGRGWPIYFVDRTVSGKGENFDFNDGEHIIYVNSSVQDETELGKLMHDFYCKNADDMNYAELAKRVRFFKEEEKGVSMMCKMMEDMRKESVKEGKIEIMVEMVKDGEQSIESAAKRLKMTEEEFRKYL